MNKQTAHLLEQHFDTAFAAPDGFAKLRELILTLAMQGKLVEQDPNDPPASEMLKEIEAEKKRASHEGTKTRRGKENKLPPIKPEEVPYELPLGWEWVRLGEIGIINPRNDAEDSATAGFVPMPLIPEGYSDKHQFEERPWSEIKKGYTHFADGDVGMAKITPCFENAKSCVFSGLPNGIGAGTTELHIFRNSFNSVAPRFLLYYLKNPNYISRAVPKMTGSAGQKRVPTPYFTEQLFPLPPLKEQHRIVARIDQLMARCDALEKLRKAREEKRLAVHAAAIKQLLDPTLRAFAPSREENSSNLRAFVPSCEPFAFLSQHFGELYTVKENVAELRKAILQLAVMGRLVPQDPNDPPASELLKEIDAEKQRLIKEKKIKKPKPLPPIKPEEVPYQLPQGWEWVRLGALTNYNFGKTPASKNPIYWSETDGCHWASISDMPTRGYLEETSKRVTIKAISDVFKYEPVPPGSLLMSFKLSIGKTAITKIDIYHNEAIISFVHLDDRLKMYLFWILYEIANSGNTKGAIKGRTLNSESISELLIPLPPSTEQHRIVARIDQLMALCDTLDQQIDAATEKQTALLNAVMAQV